MNKTTEALKRVEVWVESLTGLHTDVRQEQGEILAAIREALAEPVCEHRIADARNEFVRDGYICIKCGALFRAADHTEPVKQEPVAWMWKMHGWVVTAHGKYQAIKSYVDVCQPPLETQASDDFIELVPLCAAPVSAKREWVELTEADVEKINGFYSQASFETIVRAVITAFKEKNR